MRTTVKDDDAHADWLENILGITLIAIVAGLLIYGGYYLAKHLSYAWWYEEMVKQTVSEMVKPEALK